MQINLELDKISDEIIKSKAKSVLLQLPDGLKSKAANIVNHLVQSTKLNENDIVIWAGSCYGACDTPITDEFDLLIQLGHSKWVVQ